MYKKYISPISKLIQYIILLRQPLLSDMYREVKSTILTFSISILTLGTAQSFLNSN